MIGSGAPVEGDSLLQQVGDRNDDVAVAFNKSSIEIGKSNEGLDVQNARRGGPRENRVDFGRVHMNTFRCNNIT